MCVYKYHFLLLFLQVVAYDVTITASEMIWFLTLVGAYTLRLAIDEEIKVSYLSLGSVQAYTVCGCYTLQVLIICCYLPYFIFRVCIH